MKMHRLRFLLLVPVLLAASACGGGASEGTTETGGGPVRVATSLSVFADMIRQVGGDRVTVLSLIPPGADAHTFQPGPKDVKKLGDVRAVFINGAGLEESLEGVIEHNVPGSAKIVELSAGLTPIAYEAEAVGPDVPGDNRAGEEEHGGANPHFWLDVGNAKRYVERIRDTLAEVDAEGRGSYAANADRYLMDLDATDAYVRQQIATIPREQRKLVTFHDAFPYFARAYGLDLVGFVVRAPGREPSAREVRELGETIKRENVRTVFKEPQLNARVLDRAARDAGVDVAVLYSDALSKAVASYTEMMRANADAVARGLR
jgi:zinc/manganese transport system substrate-binding protein/manganese/iron transport system substrate-binding protein